jgi:hypothetical protein
LVLSSLSLLLTFTETFVSETLVSTLLEILCLGNSQRHLERKLLKVSEKFFKKFWFNGLTKMMGFKILVQRVDEDDGFYEILVQKVGI